MDEILIEEKKYISSKQAAKMTGYAKDYIGQLCREGRVPAQLVGRSWYVLETAIQDHRFGNPEIEPVAEEKKAAEPSLVSWESPRYEASSEESLQDSWKAWFDRFDHTEDADVSGGEESTAGPVAIATMPEEPEVVIPIHIYQPPPEELLPHNTAVNLAVQPPSEHVAIRIKSRGMNRGVIKTIQMTGAMLAVIAVAIAVIGSGYFDTYILSSRPAMMIAGVALYDR